MGGLVASSARARIREVLRSLPALVVGRSLPQQTKCMCLMS